MLEACSRLNPWLSGIVDMPLQSEPRRMELVSAALRKGWVLYPLDVLMCSMAPDRRTMQEQGQALAFPSPRSFQNQLLHTPTPGPGPPEGPFVDDHGFGETRILGT